MAAENGLGSSQPRSDDIAIIGLACRFPGSASNEAGLWDLLSNRKSAFSTVPSSRFNVDAYYHPSPNKLNTLNSRGAHFMHQDVATFDAPFFGITAQEANAMDPAARMLLEVTFEALENAGQRLEDIAGSDTSCYVGCFTRDYHEMLYRDIESVPMYTGTGTGFSLFSNRISWFYDLRGPSMTLDTACSSSLVGLHLACRGLQAGESKMAVVCGANVILSPDIALTLSNLHMLSLDGLSRSFAEGTTGYGRGEGIASLILKRVDDALRDGDHIRAVIRGSGVNQDGHTKGITLPNSDAQADLIKSVYASASLNPSTAGYFEAHGTGTAVGDPLELGAIAKSISRTRDAGNKLAVGSIKSNIGHLEGAAGLAGVIKCVLMLEKNAILPNIHFEQPNRRIPFEQWKIQVPTTLMPWPNPQLRRASVNSFGYGGTNAHVIIDDADSYLQKRISNLSNGVGCQENGLHLSKTRLIVLSARDESALERLRQSYNEHFANMADKAGSDPPFDEYSYLDSLAYTLGSTRSLFPCRTFAIVSSLPDLKNSFAERKLTSTKVTSVPRIGFVFTGQGAQWARMGLELMSYPVFARSIHEADKYLSEELDCKWSALQELGKGAGESQIELAEFSQPLSTILQVALADLLTSWGILPTVVVGHSSGEIAAAYCYGAISKHDAWKISYWRGQLCSKLPSKAPHLKGSMMAVGLGPDAVRPYVEAADKGLVVIACVNSPSSVTLSGDEAGIDEILVTLKSQNIFARKLRVQNAYHSHHMQLLSDEYLRALDGLVPQNPGNKQVVKMASSVQGKYLTHLELGPEYWVQNLVSPVLFSDAVEILLKQPTKGRRQARVGEPAFDFLLEIGPHAALKGPLRQILQAHGASHIPYGSILMRGEHGAVTALAAAGTLFCRGAQVNIQAANDIKDRPLPLNDLPSYPWNHSLKYWADSRISRARQDRRVGRHDLLGAPAQDSDSLEPRWRHFLRVSDNPWIRDHVVHSSILYPGSGILAMPLHALHTLADPNKQIDSIQLRDVHIIKALVVPDDQFGLEVFLRMRHQRPQQGEWTGWWEFSVCSNQENDNVEEHGYGLGKIHYRTNDAMMVISEKQFAAETFKRVYEDAQTTNNAEILPEDFYTVAKSVGLAYGPSFQGLTEISVGEGSCVWKIQVPDTQKIMPSMVESPHIIHPTTLDIIFHSLFAATGNEKLTMEHAAVPIGLESLKISMDHPTSAETRLKGVSKVSRDAGRDILADIYVAAEQADTPSVVVEGLRCRELPSGSAKQNSLEFIKAPVGCVVQKVDIDLLDANQLAEHISKLELTNTHGQSKEHSNVASVPGSAITAIIDLIAHKNPSASLLQVGAVSSTLTHQVLSILAAHDSTSRRFKSLTFIDRDQELINKLATKYEALGSAVQFVHTEIEKSELSLGAKDNSVDFILLSTQGLNEEKSNTRLLSIVRLLRPGGKLITVGPAEQTGVANLHNGVKAVDLPLEGISKGSASHFLEQVTLSIASKKKAESIEHENHPVVIIRPSVHSENVDAIVKQLNTLFTASGASVHSLTWPAAIPSLESSPMIISLLEFNGSFITDLSSADYSALKPLALSGKRLLWVSRGGDPAMQTATGFLRSLSNENGATDYSFLLFDKNNKRDALGVAKVIEQLLYLEDIEKEYFDREGLLYCSRWREKRELSILVGADAEGSHSSSMALGEAQGSLTLIKQKSETVSKAVFATSELAVLPLAENEVEVELRSLVISAIHSQQTMQSDWREACGIITAVGSSCSLPVGTAVSFAYVGYVSTKVRVNEQYCQALPEHINFQAASLLAITYPTAHYGLCVLGKLQSRQNILIQGAGSVLGQAGVTLAKELGANVYASAKNAEEGLLLQELGVAADHLLSEKESYQPTTLLNMTGGHGFDVIFTASGNQEAVSQLWLSVAAKGKFIDASNIDTAASFNLSAQQFTLGASFNVIRMMEYWTNNRDLYKKIRDDATSFLREHPLSCATKLPTLTVDKIQDVLESKLGPTSIDTAVLLFRQDDKLPISPVVKNQLRLHADATYILAGGLGGLGRSLAKLMVDSGAKHLVFLSRSGPGSAAAGSISEEFVPRGIRVEFFGCDVTEAESVSQVFAAIAKDSSWPSIRGIIQSAAVLRDSIFENMTHTQWTEALKPKVQGSWNLHQASLSEPCAKEGLDFFVMLASISGFVGNRGQANYAAGNSYQDALAKFRRSLGLAATSVDLGLMQDIGLIAERGGQSNLNDDTVVPLTAKDFDLIFKLAMNSEAQDVPAQIITGLPTGGILQKQGIETSPFYYSDRRFALMKVMGVDESLAKTTGTDENSASVEEQLAAATSGEQAAATVLKALRAQVAKALRCPPEDIDATKPMHIYGMDSLMAVDMRGWVQTKLKAEISLFDVMSGSSIGALAEKISKASKLVKADLDS